MTKLCIQEMFLAEIFCWNQLLVSVHAMHTDLWLNIPVQYSNPEMGVCLNTKY
jgi:hypothetical protein